MENLHPLISALAENRTPLFSEVVDFFHKNNPSGLIATAQNFGIFANDNDIKEKIFDFVSSSDEETQEKIFDEISKIEYIDNVPTANVDGDTILTIQRNIAGSDSPVLRSGSGWLGTALTALGAILPAIGSAIGSGGTVIDPETGQEMTTEQYNALNQQRQRERDEQRNRRTMTFLIVGISLVAVGLIIWQFSKKK